MNLSRKIIEEKIKNQIALEFNCSPADFDKNENVITVARLHEKRRKFSDKPFFLQMATFGKSRSSGISPARGPAGSRYCGPSGNAAQ